MPPCARSRQQADELGHEDERPRRGFRKSQRIYHLRCGQPAVGFDNGLGHVGEDGIGAAEGNYGKLRKEQRDFRQKTRAHRPGQQDRRRPERAPESHGAKCLRDGNPCGWDSGGRGRGGIGAGKAP